MTVTEICRFAPSTTGHSHPGTLLAALLAWCDARSRGGRFILRLEDIDKERCTPAYRDQIVQDLAWLGLDWDELHEQHAHAAQHEAALDALAAAGLLYPCSCSRSQIRAHGRPAPDGGVAYPNTCRGRALPAGGWRATHEPLRFRLPEGLVAPVDEGGLALAQEPAREMGDPVVRRKDGTVAYQLAVVVDDGTAGVTRIVRGRDIAPSTATQVALQRYLHFATPVYRHHLLLLEPRGDKLAKLHGSVGAPELRAHLCAEELVGFLGFAAGLLESSAPLTARDLLERFHWQHVGTCDRVVRWDGQRLMLTPT